MFPHGKRRFMKGMAVYGFTVPARGRIQRADRVPPKRRSRFAHVSNLV
jgi:hypothetical protein